MPSPTPAISYRDPMPRKGLGRALALTPSDVFAPRSLDTDRLQVKETLRGFLSGREREQIAAAVGIPVYRLANCIAETSNKNLFAYELPALTALLGPELMRWLAEQVGYSVDQIVVVELGRVSAEIARLEKRRAELLGECA